MALEETYKNQHLSVTEAERPWLEGFNLKRHSQLVDLVRDAGHRNDVALALAAWVAEKAQGKRDMSGLATRSRYRKILASLPGPDGQTPRRLIRSEAAA